MKQCLKCGARLNDNSRFCVSCGAPQSEEARIVNPLTRALIPRCDSPLNRIIKTLKTGRKRIYFRGEIPERKAKKAIRRFGAMATRPDDVILLVDDSLPGNCGVGLLCTEAYVCGASGAQDWEDACGNPRDFFFSRWKDIRRIELENGDLKFNDFPPIPFKRQRGPEFPAAIELLKRHVNSNEKRPLARILTDHVRLKMLARNGNSASLVELGGFYDSIGAYQDAASCYRQAARLGDADAMFRLGSYLEAGKGVKKNSEQAQALFKKAAEEGCEEAKSALEKANTGK